MLRSFSKSLNSRARLLNSNSSSIARNLINKKINTIPIRSLASSTGGFDTFLQSNNANYIDEMYEAWTKDPKSVHVSWDAYFKNMNGNVPASHAFIAPPTLIPAGGAASVIPTTSMGEEDILTHLKAQLLVRAYQVRGHHKAHIDPLGISFGDDKTQPLPKELTLDYYGFTEADLEREITLGPGILPRFATDSKKSMKLKDIIATCEKVYCSSYGVEYIHIPSREKY
ncbi:unnamed protein product [[Candida] boidinii]|nr:unnamed protein product [[Candida] boidinii]